MGCIGADKNGIVWCCALELGAAVAAVAGEAKAAGLPWCIMVAVCRKGFDRDEEGESRRGERGWFEGDVVEVQECFSSKQKDGANHSVRPSYSG